MPRKANGAQSPTERISERQRLEDGIRQLHARLKDMDARERFMKELAEFLSKRTLMTRHDVLKVALQVLPGRRPQRGGLDASPQTNDNHRIKKRSSRTSAKGKFGRALRQWREDNNLSTRQAADQLSVGPSTILRWESGGDVLGKMQPEILKVTGFPEAIFT